MNPLGFFDLDTVETAPGVSQWHVKCHRCGLEAQTSQDGPHHRSPDLTMLMFTHVCDPAKRLKKAAE